MPARVARVLLGIGLALVGPRGAAAGPVVMAIGDSITFGVVRSGVSDSAPTVRDRGGGYPGRLARIAGPRARVLNRGLSASATIDWLGRPFGVAPGPLRGMLEAVWPDFRPGRELARDETMLDYVRAADPPTVAVVLLGVNDLHRARIEHRPPDPPAIAGRIADIAARLRAAGIPVLLGTLLPNHRDPPAEIAAVNTALLAREPGCVRLDGIFASEGRKALLGDEVHPSEWGHALIARAFAHALKARGLVRPAR